MKYEDCDEVSPSSLRMASTKIKGNHEFNVFIIFFSSTCYKKKVLLELVSMIYF